MVQGDAEVNVIASFWTVRYNQMCTCQTNTWAKENAQAS